MNKTLIAVLGCLCLLTTTTASAKQEYARMKADQQKVDAWNRFAADVVTLHNYLISHHTVRVTEQRGGYSGASAPEGDFYLEKSYFDANTGKLLSRVKYELEHPDTIHVIEVNVYDKQGVLQRDYLAAWLPVYRNAPVQTLINFHNQNDELHAFRQFDASGERIYEQCLGRYFGKAVTISLEDYQLAERGAGDAGETYTACFGDLPAEVGAWLNPLANLPAQADRGAGDEQAVLDGRLAALSQRIAAEPANAALRVERGELYHALHRFDEAIRDYSRAIEIDASIDKAWYGRGMARGRNGELPGAIDDLGVFIKRHPDSSLAYTKRGVRRIWNGDLDLAEQDLTRAVQLDSRNAEAHDDLAVLLAKKGQYETAITHLRQTIRNDPTYQKGYHNLATVLFITRRHDEALAMVDKALRLDPGSRDSMLLKGEILLRLGNKAAAQAIIEEAEFLPESNWSEATTIR